MQFFPGGIAEQEAMVNNPNYVSSYYDDEAQRRNQYFARRAAALAASRDNTSAMYDDIGQWNAQQRAMPTAAQANSNPNSQNHPAPGPPHPMTDEESAAYANSVWGDSATNAPVGAMDFLRQENQLMGGGGPAAAAPAAGGEQQVTAALAPRPLANIGGNVVSSSPSDAMAHGQDAIMKLADTDPNKSIYQQVQNAFSSARDNPGSTTTLNAGALAMPGATKGLAAFGDTVQKFDAERGRQMGVAMAAIQQASRQKGAWLPDIQQQISQFHNLFPEAKGIDPRKWSTEQIGQYQDDVRRKTIGAQLEANGIPASNFLGLNPKTGAPEYAIAPDKLFDAKAQQGRLQAGMTHQQFLEREERFKSAAATIKSFADQVPKPGPNATAAEVSAYNTRMAAVNQMGSDLSDRHLNGGDAFVPQASQDYKDAGDAQAQAQGARVDQTQADKQAQADREYALHASAEGRLEAGQTWDQNRLTTTDAEHSRMNDARIDQMHKESDLAEQRISVQKVQQQIATQGLQIKQDQVKNEVAKAQRLNDRDAIADRHWDLRFQESQQKDADSSRAQSFSRMMAGFNAEKMPAPDLVTQVTAATLDDQITDKDRPAVLAAKKAVETWQANESKRRGKIQSTVEAYENQVKAGVSTAAPPAPATFNDGPTADAAFKSGAIKPGVPVTVAGRRVVFDAQGNAQLVQ